MSDPDIEACHGCGKPTPLDLLDSKPADGEAPETAEEFPILLCKACYGPGWLPMVED